MLKTGKVPLLLCCLVSAICFGNTIWIHAKARLAQVLIERAWSESLVTGKQVTPWPWADFWPVARITVKQSGKMLFVLSNASGASLAFGPGHVNGSVLPATAGTSIVAAHRDTHFEFLRNIKKGDVLYVQRPDGFSRSYQVTGFQVVDIRNSKLNVELGQTALKLVTCYPFDAVLPGGAKRLVVQLLSESGLLKG